MNETKKALLNLISGSDDSLNLNVLRGLIESQEKWLLWLDKIPYLNFPSTWQVKVIPPFAGAMIRFFVRTHRMPEDRRVSVYLDCDNKLGVSDGPYWEVYPLRDDVFRCTMKNTEALMDGIQDAILEAEG